MLTLFSPLSLQAYMLAISGEFLTMRLRSMAFKAYLRQEIGYFDDHKNNVGAVTTRLSTDASAVQGVSRVQLQGCWQGVSWGAVVGVLAGVSRVQLWGCWQWVSRVRLQGCWQGVSRVQLLGYWQG